MRWAWVFVLAACGRVNFDARSDGASRDSQHDAALDSTVCDEGLSGVLVCESFEGNLDQYSFQAMAPSYVTADGSRVYRGARALAAHTTRLDERAWIVGTSLPDLTSGDLWARWYLYVPGIPTQIEIASLHLLENTNPLDAVIFAFNEGELRAYVRGPNLEATASIAVPRDRWFCVRMHVVISDAAGSVETWLDATPGPALMNVDTRPATPYRNFHTGMFGAGNGSVPMTLWTDELVIGTAPIPCD